MARLSVDVATSEKRARTAVLLTLADRSAKTIGQIQEMLFGFVENGLSVYLPYRTSDYLQTLEELGFVDRLKLRAQPTFVISDLGVSWLEEWQESYPHDPYWNEQPHTAMAKAN